MKQLEIKGKYLSIRKTIYSQPIVNNILKNKTFQNIFTKISNEIKIWTLLNKVPEVLATQEKQEEIKSDTLRKRS